MKHVPPPSSLLVWEVSGLKQLELFVQNPDLKVIIESNGGAHGFREIQPPLCGTWQPSADGNQL